MIKIKTEKLNPKNSKKENFYIILTIICLVIFSSILLNFRVNKTEKIIDDKYIGTQEMKAAENIIYNNLLIIIQDLETILENNNDPSIEYLANDLYYEPFTKDGINKSTGKHKWYKFTHDNEIYIVGISSDKNVAGDFILYINKNDNSGLVRFIEDFNNFSANMNVEDLINNIKNFKIIKAFTGQDVLKGANE
ncbi:DUF6162 family protein [Oceanivirga salmonicida]|uniref:DUF6162 family protein n=1 Tax=Oceanivirga salmonicida TaxID=1769291 RepID=UPI0012E17ADD|nr:hypothetical protein [Oceanivirga salmonicida]